MLYAVYYILIFFVGAIFGSFLNLVSDRLPFEKPFLKGRSKCESCSKLLSPKELVPLLSYIFIKGKCLSCKTKLSHIYFISELFTGLGFIGIAYWTKLFDNFSIENILNFLYLSAIYCFYVTLFLTDLKFRLVPNKIVYTGIVFVILFQLAVSVFNLMVLRSGLLSDTFGVYLYKAGYFDNQVLYLLRDFGFNIVSSFAISLFFLFLIFITKGRGMGGGDVTLGFLIGMVNGFPNNILAIFLGFIIGAVVSVVLVLIKIKTIKDTIPFGPFLILGSIVAYVYGTAVLDWYFAVIK
ncbi:hypothetical protein A3F07_03330 [candidate division WWE3 bacterium RIFCSPHIGHO2_12_FULL_38_15]|uniref:Peptidase A24A N-terminal domain-containing protein n=1 Tax=candidate division WWE3 bacterium RIFCSPHIGHO2_02_FULL_38_14 TaxID=1802620 RepID=A0A1F4V713_UNCKA|nr:MAG: hypothetical protein A2793_03055 [candidate division WWE3 bacterium RIFCSPHIGHO2_01_FULL_38_45]OGC48834.1 MAG: hypothetical protein A3F07_03330 [candidate division WWE3 bacterium RIFCSPHIGHO2_12_FULL_38_15]OGC52790.1 MAG: hypothetical protein A3D91_02020 [candidate division WWE3 bacterium RIFCSPHIGHO2_02_FULL_38_14]OGC53137.1 MAG: hypothetical protein A3B64_01670 [candidate division WWE3 bacterium RIFCSPLOWO2_01_FULL_37_24]HLB51976.1 prepilin peptidase [Patescibacteria group bacterium]